MRRILAYSVIGLLLGASVGIYGGHRVAQDVERTHWDTIAPGLLFSGDHPLPLASFAALTAGAVTEDEALARITAYVNTNVDTLTRVFAEPNVMRAKALYVLYATHTSHLYGAHPVDADFAAWLRDPVAECASYSVNQALVLDALGIRQRIIAISGGTHQWIETQIDGGWEVNDATVNVWVSVSAFDMERGAPRTARRFWSPMDTVDAAPRYQTGMLRAVQDLRNALPLLGVGWHPKAYLFAATVGR